MRTIHWLLILLSFLMIFSSGKCKKKSCGEFNRELKLFVGVNSYVRNLSGHPKCNKIQDRYGINSFSDPLGCDYDWLEVQDRPPTSLYRQKPAVYYFHGSLEIQDNNGKFCEGFEFQNAGNKLRCNDYAEFVGKVPNNPFSLSLIIIEPCFFVDCRPPFGTYPRTLWKFKLNFSGGSGTIVREIKLDEGIDGMIPTSNLCL